jgi:4-hydroxyphenylpyruvate dioxygenase-like putative hemolysin
LKIHHLGIVISDLPEALEALGLDFEDVTETIYDEVQDNKIHFIYIKSNDLWIELVEPQNTNATTAKFAKKYGIGLHHIAMQSMDLRETEESFHQRPYSFILGRYKIKVNSFGGSIRTLFIAVKGLLIEFVERVDK